MLKMGVSGVRGLYGKDLKAEEVRRFGFAYGSYLHRNGREGMVVVGEDSRMGGKVLKEGLKEGLSDRGFLVVDMGIISSPGLVYLVRSRDFCGGIVVTASHNPGEWNGLKFVDGEGRFLYFEEIQKLYRIYDEELGVGLGGWEGGGGFRGGYLKAIWSLAKKEAIRGRGLKVGYDGCNGTMSEITEEVLKELGCEVKKIHIDRGDFERGVEPVARNLRELGALVKKEGYDIGFGFDPDGDRLAIISELGEAIGEEYTLVMSCDEYLREVRSDVCTNLSTSWMIDGLCKRYGVRVIRTGVGEMHVIRGMEENGCLIGGEGNGGVILPLVNLTRDSLVGVTLVLNLLSRGYRVSELVDSYDRYEMIKKTIEMELDWGDLKEEFKRRHKEGRIEEKDGIKVDYEGSYWIHIRESNTEGVIRLIMEGKEGFEIGEKMEEFEKWIRELS